MKNLFISIIMALMLGTSINAQTPIKETFPQGMKYQAVARDISGDIMANQQVYLQVQLQSNINSRQVYYSETHTVTTNQFGLFSLVIGEGVSQGDFTKIPWSSDDIWMGVAIKDGKKNSYTSISNSKLLAVPYAFHAASASKLTDKKGNIGAGVGVPSQVWSLKGNTKTDPKTDKMGTTDYTDLVFVTDNLERLRIDADGKITLGGSLDIAEDLYVGRDVFLNYDDSLDPQGQTINNGNFTVENQSSTLLTGTLDVGTTDVNSSTNLNGQVIIATDLPSGDENEPMDYPLQVKGGKQGIAISVVSEGDQDPDFTQNFITFFDDDNNALGRIEGNKLNRQVYLDILRNAFFWYGSGRQCTDYQCFMINGVERCFDNPTDEEVMRDYFWELAEKSDHIAREVIPLIITGEKILVDMGHTLVKAIIIIGPALAGGGPIGGVASDIDDFIFDTIDIVFDFTSFLYDAVAVAESFEIGGISFESGGADFAEWFEKAYKDEIISNGQVVGVKGGKISKTFTDAEQYMAITSNPIIVGGMPDKENKSGFKKVGLMGQVPVLVVGQVNPGDYILPSGKGDGTAIAINPNEMKANDFSKIIGVAWSKSDSNKRYNYINTAVGFNTNQLGMVVNNMQTVLNVMQAELVKLNPDFKPVYFDTNESKPINIDENEKLNLIAEQLDSALFECDCGIWNGGSINKVNCLIDCWLKDEDHNFKDLMEDFINHDDVFSDSAIGLNVGNIDENDNIIRKIVQKSRFIGNDENNKVPNLVVELMKQHLDTYVNPEVITSQKNVKDIFVGTAIDVNGYIDITQFDCFPSLKEILLDIRDGNLLQSSTQLEATAAISGIRDQIEAFKDLHVFLQSLRPDE